MRTTHYDVIIVGAGPAGSTTAYQLARAGVQVLVLEKYPLPRYKTCGGGITPKTAKLLDFDLSSVIEKTIYRVTFSRRRNHPFTHITDQPFCYMVMRDRFDQLLVERAQKAGATVMDGCNLKDIEIEDQQVKAITREGRRFSGKLLVGADGAHSIVARSLGLMRNIPFGIARESEIRVREDVLSHWQDLMLIDLGSVRNGYGWIFPKGKHLSIGAGSWPQDSRYSKKYYEEFSTFCRSLLGPYEVIHSQGHPMPLRPLGLPIHGPRSLLVGDAAGLINPFDGEGIYYAIRSAQIASPFILQALTNSKSPHFNDYQRAIDEQLMPEFRSARQLLKIYNLAPLLFIRGLKKSERQWEKICGLMRGDLRYFDIVKNLGPLRYLLQWWK
jgi:geranylgeranyl reductase family protein